MKVDFSGKVAAVTGAGGVLGRAMAEMYAASGAYVAVTDVNEEQGKISVQKIIVDGGRAKYFRHDVSDMNSCIETSEKIIKECFRGAYVARQ